MILHLTNDFSGSTVYKNLIKELDRLNISQIVYNPIRDKNRIGKNKIDLTTADSEIIYSPILNSHTDRIFYRRKIKKIQCDVETKIEVSQVKLIHAHTWFSDGGVAYELFKKYDIPYIVAVRNTDLNLFLKYFIHERNYGLQILKQASKIIFISPIYFERFKSNRVVLPFLSDLEFKSEVIPNGVDDFWVNNVSERKKKVCKPVELLYVGNFSTNKNVMRLLKAVEKLNEQALTFNLKMIGGGGKEENKIFSYIETKDFFSYLGIIKDKKELQEIFKSVDIFTMPSKSETFGLVYVEALSQGLPVVYTRNEGIDGAYQNIGEKVNPLDINEIAGAILKIAENIDHYHFNPRQIVNSHKWSLIASKYQDIYNNLL